MRKKLALMKRCARSTVRKRYEYYLKEGWYELIDNWGDYSSVAIVEGKVDYWLPIPPAPEGE